MPELSIRSSRALDVNASSRLGRRLDKRSRRLCAKIRGADSAQDLGVGIGGIDHRDAAWHNLAKELGLGPALLQEHFGREPERRGDVGHYCGVKADPLKAMLREGFAGNLENASLTAQRRRPSRPSKPASPDRRPGTKATRAHDALVACKP